MNIIPSKRHVFKVTARSVPFWGKVTIFNNEGLTSIWGAKQALRNVLF
jgi:hypothetical protein